MQKAWEFFRFIYTEGLDSLTKNKTIPHAKPDIEKFLYGKHERLYRFSLWYEIVQISV